jgi:peptidoglycan-N-acetylglucosamine deacetylase
MTRRVLIFSFYVALVLGVLLAWFWSPWALLLPLLPLDLMVMATVWPGCEWWGPVLRTFGSRYREVLLTFDGAPDADETPEVLVLLERYGARALFFVDAERARRNPELLREIVQRGHGVGCALSEDEAQRFWLMGPERLEAVIRQHGDALRELLPDLTVQWFRAPGELKLPWLHPVLKRLGLKLVGASASDGGVLMQDMERVLLKMRSEIGKGGVIQFRHNQRDPQGRGTMPEVLEEMLIWLKGQGYGMS